MDMEKIEAEFEFYGFTIEELKKEYERLFRMHCRRVVDKFTENVIDAAQRELTVETANKIKSLGSNALNLLKPETVRFLSKVNALIDKHMTIPMNVPIGANNLQNMPEMDDYERKCKEDIAELESVFKQQAVMMAYLAEELKFYDNELIGEAETDNEMCNLFENNFTESDCNEELVDAMLQVLKDISIE